jgi:hypothetical protein
MYDNSSLYSKKCINLPLETMAIVVSNRLRLREYFLHRNRKGKIVVSRKFDPIPS